MTFQDLYDKFLQRLSNHDPLTVGGLIAAVLFALIFAAFFGYIVWALFAKRDLKHPLRHTSIAAIAVCLSLSSTGFMFYPSPG